MNAFQRVELSQTENDIIFKKLADPDLQKYFLVLAHNTMLDIAHGGPREGQSVEEFLRIRAAAQGQLSVYETLVNVVATSNQPAQSE